MISSTGNSTPDDGTAAESIPPKRRIRIYRILLTLVTFLVSLAIAEGVLRLLLTAALDHGERLYPTTTESHPNARGYFMIASAVKENLGQFE